MSKYCPHCSQPVGEYHRRNCSHFFGTVSTCETVSSKTVPAVKSALDVQETDPNGVDAHATGSKLDAGKTLAWLCLSSFSLALNEVARVTTIGAAKYTPNGWATVPDGEQRYMEAFARHMLDLGAGKTIDDAPGGTQCLHKAQMIWNLLASLELELRSAAKQTP